MTQEEFLEALNRQNMPKNVYSKMEELFEVLRNIPLGTDIYYVYYYKNIREIAIGYKHKAVAKEIMACLEAMYPSLKPYFKPFLGEGMIRIHIENLGNLNTVERKINDLSLAVSDRRIIIIIADNDSVKMPGIPHYTMSKAKELFKFPPNHPIVNTAYAMAEVYPDHYIQLSEFHEYFKQTKHAAFIELCASLGAKEICIEKAEINNQNLDINSDIKTPLASLGLGINIRQNKETGEKIAFRFSEENKGIKDYDSPWIQAEPSWRSMNNLRRNNHLHEVGAEITCVDDMGINVNLTSQIQTVCINIGGSFNEMTKIRLSYNVIFW